MPIGVRCACGAGGAQDPLTGARLFRKILIVSMRWPMSLASRMNPAEMADLRAEALRLAEAAGDEDERWRVHVADLFWPHWRGDISAEEADEGRTTGLTAASYFEARSDWSPSVRRWTHMPCSRR